MQATEDLKGLIYRNIMEASDKRKQLLIESQLYGLSTSTIKEILKERGVNLKIFNGGKGSSKQKTSKKKAPKPVQEPKKESVQEPEPEQAEPEQAESIITEVKDIPEAESLLSASERQLEPEENDIDAILDSLGRMVNQLLSNRQNMIAEQEKLDHKLIKYANFCSDLAQIISNEGVEV